MSEEKVLRALVSIADGFENHACIRQFRGTELYHKTRDILYVKERLGHKNIQNTLIYIHLEAAIFKSGNDEFTVRTAGTVEEAKQLLEVGFEYVTEVENVKLFRKRK